MIDGAWQTLPAADATADTKGLESAIPAGAKETPVPSLQEPKTGDAGTTPVWYWRQFSLPADWKGQTIRLRFEAVAEKAEVWLNGQKLGEHTGGATPFEFTITKTAHIGDTGEKNLLALRVVGGKWGMGLWQGVQLIAHDEAYLGECVPITDAKGHVNADLALLNTSQTAGDATLDARLVPSKETARTVASTHQNLRVSPGRNSTIVLLTVGNKVRADWSPDSPSLYFLQLAFRQEKDILDTQQTAFGFREFDYQNGLITLNGAPLQSKSKWKALAAPVGRPTVIASVEDEGRLRTALHRLKENGVTLLYVYAPAPVMLRLADEEGLLIVEGARTGQSPEAAAEELRALILRDRAHPSILAWNLGDADTNTATTIRALDATRFLMVGSGIATKLWPPNGNAPVAEPLPAGLLPIP